MKIKYLMSILASVVLTAAMNASAGDSANSYLPTLSTVTSAELPAKAAELIAHASAKAVQQTTIDVVKTAVGLNPAAATAIVASIAQTSPKMAAMAAGIAAALVPEQSASIARAAAAAAPSQAGEIVEAICRAVPASYQVVADAVAEVVPGASKEILAGVSAAIPQLKDSIGQILAGYNGSIPSVSQAMNQIVAVHNPTVPMIVSPAGSPLALAGIYNEEPNVPVQGPGTGGPTTPLSGTPGNTQHAGSGGQQTSPRAYVAP